MKRDLRESQLYRQLETICTELRRPGTGRISDASDVHVSPDGSFATFAGVIVDRLEGAPPTRICLVDLATGDNRVLTFGPHTDRLPKFSPDGSCIAFLSDRHEAQDFQLHLLNPRTGAVTATPRLDGWVEYLHWSPDGTKVLLGVAGHGADISGGQGAVASHRPVVDTPPWMPSVDTGSEEYRWRRAWVYDLAAQSVRQISDAATNVWEAAWCGNGALAAVVSAGPSEGLWYASHLALIPLDGSASRTIHRPRDQIGLPVATPSGARVAVVDALCSDRGIVAGTLWLFDTTSDSGQSIDTCGVDVTYAEWRSERVLLLAGHRGFETVIGLYDAETNRFSEIWKSTEITTGGRYASVAGLGKHGDCVLVGEGFTHAPEIAVIRDGVYRTVLSCDLGCVAPRQVLLAAEPVTWQAPDGLEIQGWLLRPQAEAPYPLILHVHGGPIWHWRPAWLGRYLAVLGLLGRAYAVFWTNPRGSSGRGRDYAQRVKGDFGGAETADHLSGVQHLVDRGIADARRLGVTGGSHGGYMTSWLITQDTRFAAAVSVAPVTNYVTQHFISNIPEFVPLFLEDVLANRSGKYFERSPVLHAHKARTPTLNICGALDRCTPPEEAVQFHNALRENGVESVLVTYPQEGHGVRGLPAVIDYATRVVSWFERHLGARR